MTDVELIDLDGHGNPTELFAYIAIDDQGKAGICAGDTPLGFLPFVSMTLEDMKKWKPYMKELRKTGKKMKLTKFSAVEVIKEQ